MAHGRICIKFNSDELLMITLATGVIHQERERVVCLFALHVEVIWDTHKQGHARAGRVTKCLQLW